MAPGLLFDDRMAKSKERSCVMRLKHSQGWFWGVVVGWGWGEVGR